VVNPIDMIVPLPFIRVTSGVFLGVAVYVSLPCLPIRVLPHPQPTLATFPADGSNDGRAIILRGAVASSLVGAPPRRIARIAVFVPFFPPRSDTSHRSPSRRPVVPWHLTSYTRELGVVGATDVRTDGRGRVLPLTPPLARLYTPRVLTRPPGAALSCSPQKGSPYRGYRSADSGDSDNQSSLSCASETLAPLLFLLHIWGTASLWDESVAQAMQYFLVHPTARL
jgi:hypothetical protein